MGPDNLKIHLMARADCVLEIVEKFFWLEVAARAGLIPSARLESSAAEGHESLAILDSSIHTAKTTPCDSFYLLICCDFRLSDREPDFFAS